ncbi:hypothetical protein EI555_014371, partial [Monodon monoceros]
RHGLIPWAAHRCVYRKGNEHCSKTAGPQLLPWPNWERLRRTQHTVGGGVNKHIKGRVIAKMLIQDSVMKCLKENDQKKKETQEKDTWVQLKHQPPPSREARLVRTDGEEPELLEPVPHECLA